MKLKYILWLLFFLTMSHLSLKSQLLDTSILTQDLQPDISSVTIESAYKAPLSKLYGIWYKTNGKDYFIFNANGTGSMNTLSQEFNGIGIVWQQNFQWQKQNGQLMVRFVGEAKYTLAESDQPKYEKLTRSEKDALLNYFTSLTPKTRNSNMISDKILFLDSDNMVLQENYGNLWLINKDYIPKLKKAAKRKLEATKNTEELNSAEEASKVKIERQAENQTTFDDKSEVSDSVVRPAEFPGGEAALTRWLSLHLKYPQMALENKIEGRVIVQFIVDKDGSISSAVVTHSVDYDLDREAIRLVRSMPRWIPGKKGDVPIRTSYSLPVNFRFPHPQPKESNTPKKK